KEVVVQDLSSQQIANYLELIPVNHFDSFSVWDCCAASGGKSILAWDVLPPFSFTVSVVCASLLNNLEKRFFNAGIQSYTKQVIDLTQNQMASKKYQLIIADVPCSGSGTWGRTPEYLLHFQEQALELYTSRQEKILAQVLPALAPGGYLLYITCSVFRCENEDRVNWLLSKYPLRLIKAGLITGYTKGADTLFAALLQLQ
ncbi:MAG: Fmu (Sun) domain-containing protein, partial [Sediminibacterium sp.]|nr:Fmu (Sun) domain-containing protein [Sediminibacterium sp.]